MLCAGGSSPGIGPLTPARALRPRREETWGSRLGAGRRGSEPAPPSPSWGSWGIPKASPGPSSGVRDWRGPRHPGEWCSPLPTTTETTLTSPSTRRRPRRQPQQAPAAAPAPGRPPCRVRYGTLCHGLKGGSSGWGPHDSGVGISNPLSTQEAPTADTTGTTMTRVMAPRHHTTKGEGWALQWGGTVGDPAGTVPSTGTRRRPHHRRSTAPTPTAPSSWSTAWISPR